MLYLAMVPPHNHSTQTVFQLANSTPRKGTSKHVVDGNSSSWLTINVQEYLSLPRRTRHPGKHGWADGPREKTVPPSPWEYGMIKMHSIIFLLPLGFCKWFILLFHFIVYSHVTPPPFFFVVRCLWPCLLLSVSCKLPCQLQNFPLPIMRYNVARHVTRWQLPTPLCFCWSHCGGYYY